MSENTHNLLQKEQEFLKLNAEIDLKTKDLLTEVSQIKEIQNNKDILSFKLDESKTLITNATVENKENKKKALNESENPVSSEGNYTLTDYLSKKKDNITESVTSSYAEFSECKKTKCSETCNGRRNGRNLKLSQSAKILASVSTTIVGNESTISLGLTKHKSDIKLENRELNTEVIPETLKGVSQDGITRFLTAKVKILTDQLKRMQGDEKKYLEKIKSLQSDTDKLMGERDKMSQQANTTRSVLIKCEQHVKNISLQLQSTQNENGLLKKEVETLKKEINENKKNNSTNEIRLNRTLEEVNKLKSVLHQIKQEEKESKENHRKKVEDLSSVIKKLDKQRVELLNGFKKQLVIIDNLKRQKALIEVGKLLKCTEEDFINFLDCNPQSANKKTDSTRKSI